MKTCKNCKFVKHLTWIEVHQKERIYYKDKEEVYLCLRFPPTNSGFRSPSLGSLSKEKEAEDLIKYSGYRQVLAFNIACGEYQKKNET